MEAIAETRELTKDPATLFDLVMSGPDVYGYPTGDTSAAMHVLVSEARQEVLMVGYAVYNGRRLFEPARLLQRRAGHGQGEHERR